MIGEYGRVEARGADAVTQAIDGFRGDAERCIEPVVTQLQDAAFIMVGEQYASYGRRGPRGRTWTRKQSTIDRHTRENRRGVKSINEPMRDTDDLRISETRRGAPHGVIEAGPNYLIMGTDLVYGLIWQKRGQTQYDPTDGNVKVYGRIIIKGQRENAVNHHLDYKEGTGSIPF